MYAVITTGGKQYKVSEGDVIDVEKLGIEEGSEVKFDKVLLLGDENETRLGKPYIKDAYVTAEVIANKRARKVIVYKFKRRKNYRRKKGHRQHLTQLKIKQIIVGG